MKTPIDRAIIGRDLSSQRISMMQERVGRIDYSLLWGARKPPSLSAAGALSSLRVHIRGLALAPCNRRMNCGSAE